MAPRERIHDACSARRESACNPHEQIFHCLSEFQWGDTCPRSRLCVRVVLFSITDPLRGFTSRAECLRAIGCKGVPTIVLTCVVSCFHTAGMECSPLHVMFFFGMSDVRHGLEHWCEDLWELRLRSAPTSLLLIYLLPWCTSSSIEFPGRVRHRGPFLPSKLPLRHSWWQAASTPLCL